MGHVVEENLKIQLFHTIGIEFDFIYSPCCHS